MIKGVLKRFLSLVLVLLLFLTAVPLSSLTVSAAAAAVTGLSDDSIGLSATKNEGDATWSATVDEIEGKAKTTPGTCGDTTNETALTITNEKNIPATLSFDYTVTVNNGTIQVDDKSVTANGSFSKELKSGGTIKVSLKSGSTSAATQINMTNVKLVADLSATTTFTPSENGTFTVDGKQITESYSEARSSAVAYKLAATPAAGYRFLGWYNETEEKFISYTTPAEFNIESDCTLTAKFSEVGKAVFETGGKLFLDLNEANTAASGGNKKIVQKYDGEIPAGEYTISQGVTLLIPFDDANTVYTNIGAVTATNSTFKLYRQLKMASGAHIDVQGSLNVGGRYYGANANVEGRVTGDYGQIMMEEGSSVTIESAATLYALGFISGSGAVTVKSGAVVTEFFQIADFRGGSASGGMKNGVFPFSQYYVQNVEVPMTLEAGATEKVFSGVYAMSKLNAMAIDFIGENGMFNLISGSLTKDYDESTDRLVLNVNGKMAVNPLSLKLAGVSVNSANYVLPITNNITIHVNSGKAAINQDVAFLAGTALSVTEGAEFMVSSGKNAYFYSAAEWNGTKGFVNEGRYFRAAVNVPGRSYTRTQADLKDVIVDVNGTVNAEGGIYTTYHGDENGNPVTGVQVISSQGTGVYNQVGAPGTAKVTYQNTQSGSTMTAVGISITPARLLNADGTFTETAEAKGGDQFAYKDGKWDVLKYTVSFDANGEEGEMFSIELKPNDTINLPESSFIREGYEFTGWNTKADGSGTGYKVGAEIKGLDADLTLYAQWEAKKFTVTWTNEDGTVLKTQQVKYGTTPEYKGETPIKPEDAQYTYTFAGWAPKVTPVTGDVTYKALFEGQVKTYQIVWENDDGTVLETQQVAYGTHPAYTGKTPAKAPTDDTVFTFSGWDSEITAVDGEKTYTATYQEAVRLYSVIWQDEDGTLLSEGTVAFGETPEYTGETPFKASTAQYDYEFAGWNSKTDENGNITLTALYDATVREYTVTWLNFDGSEIKSETYLYGSMPAYSGEAPQKPMDERYVYTFKDFGTLAEVTGDAAYTAVFTQEDRLYTITWVNGETVEKTSAKYEGKLDPKTPEIREGYIFKGWNTQPDGTGTDASQVTVTEEVTLYAVWEIKAYAVVFKDHDGTVLSEQRVEYGKEPLIPADPTRDNDEDHRYTFAGWDNEIAPVTGDVTYTAQYEAIALEKHTITFDANGGVGEMESQLFVESKETELSENLFTRENYSFTSWNTKPDGSGVTYEAGSAVVDLEEDLTLYAQWKLEKGWFTDEKGTTYYLNGEMAYHSAWAVIDGSTYYFNEAGYIVKGIYEVAPEGAQDAARCVFDENGVFLKDETGVYASGADLYWINNGIIEEFPGLKRVVTEEGAVNYYYFGEDGKAVKKTAQQEHYKVEKNNGLPLPAFQYPFDENGVILHDSDTSKNGICFGEGDLSGKRFYYVDGVKVGLGLFKENGNLYYARTSNGEIICGRYYLVSQTNGIPVEKGTYYFNEEGVLQLTGFWQEGDFTYYYLDGVLAKGFTKVGEDYYFFNAGSGKMYKDVNLWVGTNDYGFTPGMYTFGSDGKMLIPDLENGKAVLKTIDGHVYIMIDGASAPRGLYEIDGEYYYTKYSGALITDSTLWLEDLSALGEGAKGNWRTFGADGKMVKDGFLTVSGATYHYTDAVLSTGFTKVGEDYYFFNAGSGKMYKNVNLWVGTNDYGFTPGMYTFGADGKLLVPDLENGKAVLKTIDGHAYIMIDGVSAPRSLYEIDGEYYYTKYNGALITDSTLWLDDLSALGEGAKGNWRAFGADGKMVKDGFLTVSGATYHYADAVLSLGFTKVGDDYYLFNAGSGKMYKDANMWVGANNYGVAPGMYTFGSDGKMI